MRMMMMKLIVAMLVGMRLFPVPGDIMGASGRAHGKGYFFKY
jgi:hypothetical protein